MKTDPSVTKGRFKRGGAMASERSEIPEEDEEGVEMMKETFRFQ